MEMFTSGWYNFFGTERQIETLKENEHMRNAEETVGKMIDKAGTSFISYVDNEGYPSDKSFVFKAFRGFY